MTQPLPPAAIDAFLQRGGDLLVATDGDGCLSWTNARFLEATGLATADVLGRPLASLLAADDGVQFERARTGAAQGLTLRLRTAGGGTLACRANVVPYAGGHVAVLHVAPERRRRSAAVDEAAMQELARSLGETHAHLELALEVGGIATWRHDLRTDLMHYDARAFDILQMTPRPQGLTLDEVRALIHPEDLPTVIAAARQAHDGDGSVDVEARYRRADGQWRHILTRRALQRDAAGEPLAYIGVGIDITERVDESRRALELARRLETTAASAGIGLWRIDLDSGRSEWNAQMFQLFGLPPGEQPPPFDELMTQRIHPDDRERLRRDGYSWIHEGERAFEIEYRVRLDDGSVRWLLNRSDVDRDAGQRRLFGVTLDVSERKRVEAERHERLAAQRDSRAKSEFLARMSHELRTPLNAVLGFSQLMLAAPGDASADRTRLEHVHAAGQHLLSLIDGVLDLSSLEAGALRMELAAVALAPLVQETLPLVEPLAQARGVDLRCGELDAVVRADPTRLRQVLLNLLTNAVKYNRRGGHVELQAHGDGRHVRLAVRDSGRGMDAAQLAHLFEPFNRLGMEREGIEGTGIGLAIVQAIVARMGATIDVSSTPGRGSRFVVTLEDARQAALPLPLPAAAPPPPAAAAAFRGRLLYIEDNPVNVVLVEALVARCPGLELVSEGTGERGVARARALRPDLVLVDMQLPDFDGHEVLRRLRADPATAALPCIALSANAMGEDIDRALAAGFADYWTKPIDLRAFLASMQALFGRRDAAAG